MKGLIYVVVAFVTMGLIIGFGLLVVISIDDLREKRAIANARWSPYTKVRSDGDVEVGVERVAYWGSSTRELAQIQMIRVPADEVLTINEAIGEAANRAAQYNALLPGSK